MRNWYFIILISNYRFYFYHLIFDFDIFSRIIIVLSHYHMKYIFLLAIMAWCSSKAPVVEPQIIEKPQARATIITLWDSLTAGYQLPIEQSYPSQLQNILNQAWYIVTVINAWKSWDRSDQLLSRLWFSTQDLASWSIAILAIWANDGLQSKPIDQIKQNISTIIEQLQKQNLVVVLAQMQLPSTYNATYRTSFEDIYLELVKKYNLIYIPQFLQWVWGISQLNLPDGIHPTWSWYAIISQRIATFITPLLNDTTE